MLEKAYGAIFVCFLTISHDILTYWWNGQKCISTYLLIIVQIPTINIDFRVKIWYYKRSEVFYMIRIAIVDDDNMFWERIKSLLVKIMNTTNIEYTINTFIDGDDFLSSDLTFDLLLFDIDMPKINGFDLVKRMNSLKLKCSRYSVIYISNYENLVFESFKYSPLRFVRKNMLESDFPEAIEAFLSKYLNENNCFAFIDRESNAYVKIRLMDIMYFESFGHDICVVEKTGKVYKIKRNIDYTLNRLENQYSSNGFIRSHKSYLVNYRHIYKIQENKIYFMKGNIALITIRNVKEFKIKYQSLVMKEQI